MGDGDIVCATSYSGDGIYPAGQYFRSDVGEYVDVAFNDGSGDFKASVSDVGDGSVGTGAVGNECVFVQVI